MINKKNIRLLAALSSTVFLTLNSSISVQAYNSNFQNSQSLIESLGKESVENPSLRNSENQGKDGFILLKSINNNKVNLNISQNNEILKITGSLNSKTNENISITIEDKDKNIVHIDEIESDSNGNIDTVFDFSDNLAGEYTLSMNSESIEELMVEKFNVNSTSPHEIALEELKNTMNKDVDFTQKVNTDNLSNKIKNLSNLGQSLNDSLNTKVKTNLDLANNILKNSLKAQENLDKLAKMGNNLNENDFNSIKAYENLYTSLGKLNINDITNNSFENKKLNNKQLNSKKVNTEKVFLLSPGKDKNHIKITYLGEDITNLNTKFKSFIKDVNSYGKDIKLDPNTLEVSIDNDKPENDNKEYNFTLNISENFWGFDRNITVKVTDVKDGDIVEVTNIKTPFVKSITPLEPIFIKKGTKPELPKKVTVLLSDGTQKELPVTWTNFDHNKVDSHNLIGTVDGTSLKTSLIINVYENSQDIKILPLEPIKIFVGDNLVLPKKVKVKLPNNSLQDKNVTWNNIPDVNKKGEYTLQGSVEGTSEKANLKLSIVNPEIKSIEKLNPITLDYGASYNLPKTVKVTLENGKVIDVQVEWDKVINTKVPGVITVNGKLKDFNRNISLSINIKGKTDTNNNGSLDNKDNFDPKNPNINNNKDKNLNIKGQVSNNKPLPKTGEELPISNYLFGSMLVGIGAFLKRKRR
ncbi:Ig-like domain-containing protein [Hathewaya histolytica]|uniref:Ig-like domain-containing protein n=1 Tax=Hathewaya histolytica TaxID=1498 RepID=UPI003B685C32